MGSITIDCYTLMYEGGVSKFLGIQIS